MRSAAAGGSAPGGSAAGGSAPGGSAARGGSAAPATSATGTDAYVLRHGAVDQRSADDRRKGAAWRRSVARPRELVHRAHRDGHSDDAHRTVGELHVHRAAEWHIHGV